MTNDYPEQGNDFTGTIKWLQLQNGDDDHSHLIDPALVAHAAMARQ